MTQSCQKSSFFIYVFITLLFLTLLGLYKRIKHATFEKKKKKKKEKKRKEKTTSNGRMKENYSVTTWADPGCFLSGWVGVRFDQIAVPFLGNRTDLGKQYGPRSDAAQRGV